jgi:hypothetical protein
LRSLSGTLDFERKCLVRERIEVPFGLPDLVLRHEKAMAERCAPLRERYVVVRGRYEVVI